ncbi:hypothetical protein F3K24_07875 [Streptomyces sp. LBUM 1485]|nr:hypothetical protein [Streptomyces sp. LBUM 1485]
MSRYGRGCPTASEPKGRACVESPNARRPEGSSTIGLSTQATGAPEANRAKKDMREGALQRWSPTGRRAGRLPMSRCGFPPRDPAGRLVDQRLNRCAGRAEAGLLCMKLLCVRGGVRSAGTRTYGRAAQSSPVHVPRQRNSGNVPQDIPRCQSRPPRRF